MKKQVDSQGKKIDKKSKKFQTKTSKKHKKGEKRPYSGTHGYTEEEVNEIVKKKEERK